MDNLVKHNAYGHSKLDEYILDDNLIKRKREEHAKKPKRFNSALKQHEDKYHIRTNQDAHEVAVAESVHEGQNLDRKYL